MKFKNIEASTAWFIAFNLFNASIASLVCLSNFPNDELFWSIQSWLFGVTANFGHFSFLFLIVSAPFWWVSRFTSLEKLPFHLTTLINIFLITAVYLDARIFELYKFHLNGMIIELLTGGALQDILSFNALVWSLFASIAIAFFIFEILLGKYLLLFFEKNRGLRLLSPFLFMLFLISSVVSQGIYILSDAKGDTTITSMKRYIPWAQTITAKRRLRELGVEINESETKRLSYSNQTIKYPQQQLSCEQGTNYNVLLLVVDSLRWDMLDENIMPESWKLAQKSHVFQQYFSLANSTRFGLFTLMYGLPGSYWHSMLGIQKGSVLFDVLLQNDYDFYIYSAAPLYSPEFDRTIFTKVKEHINIGPTNTATHIKDRFITDELIKKLDSHNQENPFFGFMFYDSPHSYSYPKTFEEKFKPSWKKINYLELDNDFDPEKFFNRYKNSAAFTDTLIGEVIDKLESKGLLDNTIVVFTSDHGQEFNETRRNFWGHNGNFSRYQTQVPFYIYWPESHPLHGAQTYQQLAASIDFVPTLLNQGLHCVNPVTDYSLGYDLYAPQNNYARPLHLESWSKRAILGKDYIMVFHDAGGSEIFDRDYNHLPDFKPPEQDFSIIFKQLSTFRNKKSRD